MATTHVMTCDRCAATLTDARDSLFFTPRRQSGLPHIFQTDAGQNELCGDCFASLLTWWTDGYKLRPAITAATPAAATPAATAPAKT